MKFIRPRKLDHAPAQAGHPNPRLRAFITERALLGVALGEGGHRSRRRPHMVSMGS